MLIVNAVGNNKVLFVYRKAARGDSPTLKLEIQFVQNKVRAAITALSNKEERETELAASKFERSVLQRNVNRGGSLNINIKHQTFCFHLF